MLEHSLHQWDGNSYKQFGFSAPTSIIMPVRKHCRRPTWAKINLTNLRVYIPSRWLSNAAFFNAGQDRRRSTKKTFSIEGRFSLRSSVDPLILHSTVCKVNIDSGGLSWGLEIAMRKSQFLLTRCHHHMSSLMFRAEPEHDGLHQALSGVAI